MNPDCSYFLETNMNEKSPHHDHNNIGHFYWKGSIIDSKGSIFDPNRSD